MSDMPTPEKDVKSNKSGDVKEKKDSQSEQLSLQKMNKGDSNSKLKATMENNTPRGQNACNIDFLLDIPLEITIELDRTTMLIHELLKLGQGSVIELSKFAGETLDVLANQRLIAKGEVVVINDKYGIRLTEIISPMERIVKLK